MGDLERNVNLVSGLDKEIARLRAEVAEYAKLKEYAKSLGQRTYLELWAEVTELRTFVSNFADSKELSGRSMLLFIKAARELLDKLPPPDPPKET